MQKKNRIIAVLLVAILPVISVFSYGDYLARKEERSRSLLFERRKANWDSLKQAIFKELAAFNGEAGVVVKDLSTGWEIAVNREKLFPSASLAKVPLMAALLIGAEEGRIRLERNIALKNADKLSGSGFLKEMPAGSLFSVARLIGLMIYESDNTATNMLTNISGIDNLNRSFENFGLKNTRLLRKIADYGQRDKGIENYTSAEDIALLFEDIYRGRLGGRSVSGQCIRFLKLARSNDRIPRYLPAELAVAHKTGLERGVCHDAGIVYSSKGDFLIVVLTGHREPDSSSAKEFIARVSLFTYRYFEQLP